MAINSRAVNALVITNLAASIGGFSWMFTDMLWRRSTKMSLNGFCCGAVAGLVAITPASGFVSPYYSLVFGLVGKYLLYKHQKYVSLIMRINVCIKLVLVAILLAILSN